MSSVSRRTHLREYILACVRESALSWADLASPMVIEKFLTVLSKDARIVLKELAQDATANVMQMGMQMLAGMAANAMAGMTGKKK